MGSSRSRCSPRLRGNTFARSAVGFRDQLALLETPHRITSICRQPYGSSRDRSHMSRIVNNAPVQLFSPLPMEDTQARSNRASTYSPRQYECDSRLPALLVPDLCVTTEMRVVGSGYHNFWVAIEVMARSHVPGQNDEDVVNSSGPRSLHSPHSADLGKIYNFPMTGLSLTFLVRTECGSLYDLQVNIEPTTNSRIVEVIEHEVSPMYALANNIQAIYGILTTGCRQFTAGCKALILANVELELEGSPQPRGHVRSQSDELMEDLEHQLGSAQCEYMRINLIYRHSAFSFVSGPDDSNGVLKPQTKIRTTFTAALAQHNAASPWSPPPAPTPNRLVGIIAAH